MNALTLLRLALGLVSLANWIFTRVDRAEWVKIGRDQAQKKYLEEYQATMAKAQAAVAAVAKMSQKEKEDILRSDL